MYDRDPRKRLPPRRFRGAPVARQAPLSGRSVARQPPAKGSARATNRLKSQPVRRSSLLSRGARAPPRTAGQARTVLHPSAPHAQRLEHRVNSRRFNVIGVLDPLWNPPYPPAPAAGCVEVDGAAILRPRPPLLRNGPHAGLLQPRERGKETALGCFPRGSRLRRSVALRLCSRGRAHKGRRRGLAAAPLGTLRSGSRLRRSGRQARARGCAARSRSTLPARESACRRWRGFPCPSRSPPGFGDVSLVFPIARERLRARHLEQVAARVGGRLALAAERQRRRDRQVFVRQKSVGAGRRYRR